MTQDNTVNFSPPEGEDTRDWVVIAHPQSEGTHTCLREAFTDVWEAKGWQLVEDHASPPPPPPPDTTLSDTADTKLNPKGGK